MSLGRLKAQLDEERFELIGNIFVAILRPVDLTTRTKRENIMVLHWRVGHGWRATKLWPLPVVLPSSPAGGSQ